MQPWLSDPCRGMRVFLYARKSTEGVDRQVQSIDAQVAWGWQVAEKRGLNVIEVIPEERSAKEPFARPRFMEMMQRLQNGEADGILTWQVNRLSRNPVDSGQLQWLLQREVIKAIIASDRDYLPSDNSLLLSIDTGVSTQYVRDLAANTWRGTKTKLALGWFPGRAPVGYLNEPQGIQGQRRILVDEERWDGVRQLWDLVLTGTYNPRQAVQIINARGFRSRWGNPMKVTGVYAVLNNLFYTGMFEYRGELYEGQHRPMVTMAEFNRVQQILGAKGRPHPQAHEFAYTGLIRCGECGCMITAETKTKYLKGTGETVEYTYYHCTKATRNCSQKTIRVEALEAQIAARLADLTIVPQLAEFAGRLVARQAAQEDAQRATQNQRVVQAIKQYEKELYDLQKAYTRNVLEEDFFTQEKDALKRKIVMSKRELTETDASVERWPTLTNNAFLFAARALIAFESAGMHGRRELFSALGRNFTLQNGRLNFEPAAWFETISENRSHLSSEFLRTRTSFGDDLQIEMAEICGLLPLWCRTINGIRTAITDALKAEEHVAIPELDAVPTSRPSSNAHTQLVTARYSRKEIQGIVVAYRRGDTFVSIARRYATTQTIVKTLLRHEGAFGSPATPLASPDDPSSRAA